MKNQSGLFDATDADAYPDNTDKMGYQVTCNKCGDIGPPKEDQLDALYIRDSHDCLEISMDIKEVQL